MNEMVYSNYRQFKQELDTELQKTSESFVRIGYLLKVAMDTDILKESGYFNVNDFARNEYGLDPTQVSRFININNRFSENGNSPYLREEFRGIGYAKLSIMLQLPDCINEEITTAFSKSEIQAIKDEVDAEKEKTDIEVILEGTDEKVYDNNLSKVLFQLGHDEKEVYVRVYNAIVNIYVGPTQDIIQNLKMLHEALAPNGENIYSVRIRGVGRLLLSIKDVDREVTLTNIRTEEKEVYSWQQLVDSLKEVLIYSESPEKSWEQVYGETFQEEKAEIAPVQPVQRKQPKVTKAKEKPKKKETKAAVQPKTEENVPKPEETVSKSEESVSKNQESVSEDENKEIVTAEMVEIVENTPCDEDLKEELQKFRDLVNQSIQKIQMYMENDMECTSHTIDICITNAEFLLETLKDYRKGMESC